LFIQELSKRHVVVVFLSRKIFRKTIMKPFSACVIFLIFSAISQTFGIKCYRCAGEGRSCNTNSIDCGDVKYCSKQVTETTSPIKSLGVVEMCGLGYDVDAGCKKDNLPPPLAGTIELCYCKSDNCNGVGKCIGSSLLILFTLVALLAAHAIY